MDADKKAGAARLVNSLSDMEAVRTYLDVKLRSMTTLHNTVAIRHHEHGKAEISDENLIECLFYDYYNLIWFVLTRQNRTQRCPRDNAD